MSPTHQDLKGMVSRENKLGFAELMNGRSVTAFVLAEIQAKGAKVTGTNCGRGISTST